MNYPIDPILCTQPIPITMHEAYMCGGETDDQRKLRFLRALRSAQIACSVCELGRKEVDKNGILRDPHVFSNMNVSRFMIVGQRPFIQDVISRNPLSGKYGNNFKMTLEFCGLCIDDFYITNAVKCYSDGDPSSIQTELCSNYLRLEIGILQPILVVTLGEKAYNYLCDGDYYTNLSKISKSPKFGVNVFSTFDPTQGDIVDKNEQFLSHIQTLYKLIDRLKTTDRIPQYNMQ